MLKTNPHLCLLIDSNNRTINKTNKTPCPIPTSLTGIGLSPKYLIGIAINRSIIYETPSKKLINRNLNIGDISIKWVLVIFCRALYLKSMNFLCGVWY